MKLVEKYPILGSSVDPEKISLTIKSVGLMIVPLVVVIARGFDLEIAENDLVQVVTAIAGIVSMLGVIFGAFRKYVN